MKMFASAASAFVFGDDDEDVVVVGGVGGCYYSARGPFW